MNNWTRRGFILSAGAGLTTACAGGTESTARDRIDRDVDLALQQMQAELPFTSELVNSAAGMLVMPKVTKAGLIIGGTYGEGSLMIGNAPVDYYSVAGASYGLQAGAQQYSSVLFFMDSAHLQKFRARNGWTLGADVEYTIVDNSGAAGIDNNTIKDAVYAVIFNQAGLLAGISVEGSKYSRIVR
ncbi:MAG: twin-arginine translocation pathway signal sequence domain protein [Rhodobacteraceae bacterium]|nr:twin-arginine translocation pathway signal sequence domain protein [Paracoccaceae bacterium]